MKFTFLRSQVGPKCYLYVLRYIPMLYSDDSWFPESLQIDCEEVKLKIYHVYKPTLLT